MQSQPQCSKHWAEKSVCLHLNPSNLEKGRNTEVWVEEEGLEKGQRGSGTGGDKSPGRAAGLVPHGISVRMCGSAWREGEKAVDKPKEGNRVELCSVVLSISSTKACLWVVERWLFSPPDSCPPLPCCPIPSHPGEGKGNFAQLGGTLVGLTPTHCLGTKRSDHFWQHGWKKARSTEISGLTKLRGTFQ